VLLYIPTKRELARRGKKKETPSRKKKIKIKTKKGKGGGKVSFWFLEYSS